MSKLITSNLDAHWGAIKVGAPAPTFRSSGGTRNYPPQRKLPILTAAKHMVSGGVGSVAGSVYANRLLEKSASMSGLGANVQTSSPEIRNPLLNLINFYLPYDRKTLNQWIRYYYKFHPYIRNCINLHAEFPISDFHFTGISDPGILEQFDELKETAKLVDFCFKSSKEYELLGEAYGFQSWDEDELIWKGIRIMNPDQLDIQDLNFGDEPGAIYTMEPDEELKMLVKSADPRVLQLLQDKLDPVVYENLLAGTKIPIDEFNVIAMRNSDSEYEPRGTSNVLSCIKDLMYEDKLREAQYAIADQQITPVQIWKIGDPATGYMPDDAALDAFRELLLAGRHDPLFTIVSHAAIKLELVGYTGQLLPVIPEFEFVGKRIMVALFTNDAMVTGSSGPYANGIVGFKTIEGRYQSKRDKIVDCLKTKNYKPFAQARQLFQGSTADAAHGVRTSKGRKLAVPGMEWNFKLDLTDQTQRNQYLADMRKDGVIPMRTICEVFNMPYEQTKQALKDEEGTVFDPAYQAWRLQRVKDNGTMPTASGGMGGAPTPDMNPDTGPSTAPPEEESPASPPEE